MEKRGQVSIFIILGIVVVGIIGAGVYLGTQDEDVVLESPIQVDPVRKHVEECLDLVSLRGLELIGLQGGYTNINNKDVLSYLNGKMNVVYWLDESSLKAPKFSLIERNLEKFIEKDMKECVVFELFEDFLIEDGEIDVDVDFEEEVEVKVNWPLRIKKENLDYEVKDFFGNYEYARMLIFGIL